MEARVEGLICQWCTYVLWLFVEGATLQQTCGVGHGEEHLCSHTLAPGETCSCVGVTTLSCEPVCVQEGEGH
jgi:hypothetical protein